MKVVNLFVLPNLRSTETGVEGAVIWIAAGEFAGADTGLGPRLVVVPGDNIAPDHLPAAVNVRLNNPSEALEDLPSDIAEQIVTFVTTNCDVLLRYWNGALSTSEMMGLLERQPPGPPPPADVHQGHEIA